MKIFLSISILLCCQFMAAQKNDVLVIYFKTNQVQLTPQQQSEINQRVESFRKQQWDSTYIGIKGFADESGPADANMRLSLKRARMVKHHIQNIPFIVPFDVNAYGEKFSKGKDKNLSRRVEITFYGKKKGKIVSAIAEQKEKDSLNLNKKLIVREYRDSIIHNKTAVVIIPKEEVKKMEANTNFHFQFKNCSIEKDSINGLTTQDIYGNPLSSAGMFKIDYNSKDTVLEKPIIVRFPISDTACFDTAGILTWRYIEGKGWKQTRDPQIRIVTVNNQKYYEVQTFTPSLGLCNMDKLNNYYTTRFRIKNNFQYKIDSIVVFDKCNSMLLKGRPTKYHKRSIKIKIPYVDSNLEVIYFVTNKKTGKSMKSDAVSVNALKKGFFYSFVRVPKLDSKRSTIMLSQGFKSARKTYMH
ncbi:MAG: OmpA family protein [Bacteroidetes bacterium]|nr:OmpA family protein [Bacteroidota bacterium]